MMSKILKQNGASGKIIRAASSGKVLKQNYNVGNGYVNNTVTGINIQIPVNFSITGDFSIFMKMKYKSAGSFSPTIVYYNNNSAFITSKNTASDFIVKTGSANSNQNNLLGYAYSNGNIKYLNNSGNIQTNVSLLSADVNTINFRINGGSGGTVWICADVFIWNRSIDNAELLYLFNNSLYNDVLNVFGLTHKIHLNSFINDGADVYSENVLDNTKNAVVVDGLPAGTIEEQTAYMNANFVQSW